LAVSAQVRDLADVDSVGLGDRGQCLAGRPALQGLLALKVGEFGFSAEPLSLRRRELAALGGALGNQVALETDDCGQDGQEQPAL
jgi:hypothetical protein